jgi:hypothetical protein
MHINNEELRWDILELLKTRTKNQIVQEIKATNEKFHQFQIDNFIQGKDVTLSTLKKLDVYNYKQKHLH